MPSFCRNYDKPPIVENRLEEACRNFCIGITKALKSLRSTPVHVNLDLDIWRFVTCGKGKASEHRGHHLFERDDLTKFKYLPDDWWYFLNQQGEGVPIDFPLKAKPILSWSSDKYIKRNGQLLKAKKYPVEKVCITVVRKAYSADQ